MKVRQATKKDFEQVHELTAYSYGFDPMASKESWMKRWELNFDEQYLTELDNGKITANARMIPFEQNIRNNWLKMGGVAMVATDPIYRRKGHVREIMKFLVKKMAKENYDISTLYPFKDTFYAKFGYTNISANTSLKLNPKFFSRWKKLPEGYTIKKLNHEQGFDILKEIHEKAIAKIHGSVKRSEKRWKEYDRPTSTSYIVAFNKDGIPEGILRGIPKGFMTDFDWAEDGVLNITDFWYLTTKAKLALFTFIYLNSDQVVSVKLPIRPQESEYYPWLQDYFITEIDSQNIWQARIINIKTTLEKMNPSVEGSIEINFKDEIISENNQIFEITAKNNTFKVKKSKKKNTKIVMTINGLTSLVFGVLNANEIDYFNWLENATEKQKELLDNWFPKKIPYITEGF